MKCIVLAAGYATRLYPLTENFPKPLLPVGGKPILDWLIDDIDGAGCVTEYVVISNHKYAAHFEEWKKTRREKITVLDDGTVTNETRLGAVRDMKLAFDACGGGEDFFVIAGDNVLDFSLTELISYAGEKKASAAMRYFEPEEARLKKSGVVTVGEDGRVLSMTEKSPTPASHWCVPPFYYYKEEDAALAGEAIAAGCPTDAPGSFLAFLASRRPVYAMEMKGKRFDVGNLADYEKIGKEYGGIVSC